MPPSLSPYCRRRRLPHRINFRPQSKSNYGGKLPLPHAPCCKPYLPPLPLGFLAPLATAASAPFELRPAATMADVDDETGVAAGVAPKKRTFRKYSCRGVDLDALLDMSTDDLVQLFPARVRRRFQRGLKRKPMVLIKKLRKAKKDAPVGEKLEPVRTHIRNMFIVSER